jgi:hypothetical protein
LKKRLNYLLLLLFVLASLGSMAQVDTIAPETIPFTEVERPVRPKQNFLYSPRGSLTVPLPIGNSAFRKSFVGVYEFNGGFNVMVYKGIFAGLTYKNSLLIITPTKIPDYNASMTINSGAFKVGNDFYLGDRNSVILSTSIAVGQNNSRYHSFVSKDFSKRPSFNGFKASYVEPEIDMYFLVESNFAIGASVTYSIINRNFDPSELYLDQWAGFPENNSGLIRYLSFGFGVYYGFAKRSNQ